VIYYKHDEEAGEARGEPFLRVPKEAAMATVKNRGKEICDEVYTEFSGIKEKLETLRTRLTHATGVETKINGLLERHITELEEQIDWRLQILSHACPYDWKGSSEKEYEENTVSVGPAERTLSDFSGGYLGG
jgi:hypothetical protein